MGRAKTGSALALSVLLAAALSAPHADSKLSAPTYGETIDLVPVSGTVRVHVPGQTRFTPLEVEEQVPVGSIVDTDRGRVRLISARSRRGSLSQAAEFYDGTFRVLQPESGRPLTVLKLENGVVCPARSAGRGLWGSGSGNFQTRGKHGSATVRGTIWWAQDNCRGTYFKVRRGVVTIRDFGSGRTLRLHAGERYLAPNG